MFRFLFPTVRAKAGEKRPSCRPRLETLEDRITPSALPFSGNYDTTVIHGNYDTTRILGNNDTLKVHGSGDSVTLVGSKETVAVKGGESTVIVFGGHVNELGDATVTVS